MERNEKIKNAVLGVVIAGLVVALIMAFLKINELNHNYISLMQNHDSDISIMHSNIEDIYNNVDEKLKKQASILTDYEIEYGPLDTENLTTPLKFTVTPKSASDDTTVSVTVADTTVKLSRDGEAFSGCIDVDAFIENDTMPLITVKSDGSSQNEALEDENLSCIFTRFMPYLFADMSLNQENFSNAKIRLNGELRVESKPSSEECTTTFEQYFLVADAENKQVFKKDITQTVEKTDGYFSIEHIIEVPEFESVEYFVLATDSLGFTHKFPITTHYLDGDKAITEDVAADGWGLIYDKNGKLVYGEEQ